ncbi:MAG TPA: hypothetical protein DCR63_00860, partial [Microbacterium sp.]|nr:hypothetical protein [Microbacterium sp.]
MPTWFSSARRWSPATRSPPCAISWLWRHEPARGHRALLRRVRWPLYARIPHRSDRRAHRCLPGRD